MSLLTHLVESTAFAAVVWLLTLAFRRDQARTRYWLWMAASVKFLIPFALLVWIGGQVDRSLAVAARGGTAWGGADRGRPGPTFLMAEPGVAPQTVTERRRESGESRQVSLGPALLALWVCGSAWVLIRWRRSWRVAMSAAGDSSAWTPPGPLPAAGIPIRSSRSISEPAVFGILRPVLLLPLGIEDRLSVAQLRSILAHELCHVRRRDNLTAAIHMLVEAIFWFHPLVWWIGARLVEERERACDEDVVLLGSEPAVYAESILAVCQFCIESPLPCVSAVSGADLKRRVAEILSPGRARPLALGKKALLAACALAVVAGPVAFGLTHAVGRAQSLPENPKPLKFDVLSVKEIDDPVLWTRPKISPGRITWQTQLWYLVHYAFRLEDLRISGVPATGKIYMVEATTTPDATNDQIRLMLQSMLRDRFAMEAHRETKVMEGYALTVAAGGLRIRPAKEGDKPPGSMKDWDPVENEGWFATHIPRRWVGEMNAYRVTMPQFADALQGQLDAAVWDQTGLTEKYFINLEFALKYAPTDFAGAPTLFVALKKNLGLQLEKHKGPVEILVIDHMETTPTAN